MKLTDKLRYLSEGLGSIGVTIHHYHRPLNAFPCIVWAEEGGDETAERKGVGGRPSEAEVGAREEGGDWESEMARWRRQGKLGRVGGNLGVAFGGGGGKERK